MRASLVAQRARSVAELLDHVWNHTPAASTSFRTLVWYTCITAMVCRAPPIWPIAAYALPTSFDVNWQGFEGKVGAFHEDATPNYLHIPVFLYITLA